LFVGRVAGGGPVDDYLDRPHDQHDDDHAGEIGRAHV